MIWNNWSDFFAMGGYGLYVWGSVTVVFAVLLGEVIELAWRGKAIKAELLLARAARQRGDRKQAR
ncbi:MAG: heme exporter protein CcmD [Leptothrix sp. (in: Bacteria)]|nr:heme exporter protein CcmD [Leptothrix sp. (in: b-proteobacteria)]